MCNNKLVYPTKLSGGAIAGIVIGTLIAVVLGFTLAVFVFRKRSSQESYDLIH